MRRIIPLNRGLCLHLRVDLFLVLVFAFLAGISCTGKPADGLKAVALKCEYRTDPLGIDSDRPRLSWELESNARGKRQSAFRIMVASSHENLQRDHGDLRDTGRVESNRTVNLEYDGLPLASGQRCWWKVMVWDEQGEPSPWSEPAWWEMALLDVGDWTGSWIGDGRPDPEREEDFYSEDPAPLLRRGFAVERPVRRARLYVTGPGYYRAYLNGEQIGDHELDPGWTDYRDRVFYSTCDVTDLLQQGENVLAAELGNGWYNPLPLRMWSRRNLREDLPVGRPRLLAQLEIEFADGSSLTIASDESWRIHPGPLVTNNIYLGEIYDARREIDGWNEPGFDDSGWEAVTVMPAPGGHLEAQPQPPITITRILEPVAITEPESGVFIVDFGQNFSGWVRLRLSGEAGTTVRMRFGELLHDDGTLNPMTSVCGQIKGTNSEGVSVGGPGAPPIAWQEDTYIARGRDRGRDRGRAVEYYTPRFTFHAFRYVEVTGYPGRPGRGDLTGLQLHSAVEQAGSFTCSDDRLNRIQEMVRRTFLSNIFSVQSDCPHRERFGYGGDLVVTSDAFMMNFDMANFYAKAVRDWHDAALPGGMLTDTAPFVGIQYCGVAWAMAHPHLLESLYRYYGDRRLIEEQYATASRWLDLVTGQYPDHIVTEGLSDHEGLEPAPAPVLVTPLYAESARLCSRLAGLLGREEDRQRYAELAAAIGDAWQAEFLDTTTGLIGPGTQTGQAMALFLDLVPEADRPAVLARLVEMVRNDHNGHLATGIFGTRYLLDVLSRTGQSDLAVTVATQETFPGWGFMLASGATTLWEHWDFSDNTFSHNHPMFGSVSGWFYHWLGGIQPHPEAEAFDRIIIRPQPAQGLTHAETRHHSVRGPIACAWQRRGERFRMQVTIPPNTEATVYIPAREADVVRESGKPAGDAEGVTFLAFEEDCAVYRVGSGQYSFSSRWEP